MTEQALAQLSVKPQVIHIDDSTYQDGKLLGDDSYEDLVNQCPVDLEPLQAWTRVPFAR